MATCICTLCSWSICIHNKKKTTHQKWRKKYNLGRSFFLCGGILQWGVAKSTFWILYPQLPVPPPSIASSNSRSINILFMSCVFHGLGLSSGLLWFFLICLFMCDSGWHCAVSQLVRLQWMPYDDGFSHLCSAASDIAVTYVCSSPPAKPFQGKAMPVGNKHRPDPCNQCFSWALPSNIFQGVQLMLPLGWQSLCKLRKYPK